MICVAVVIVVRPVSLWRCILFCCLRFKVQFDIYFSTKPLNLFKHLLQHDTNCSMPLLTEFLNQYPIKHSCAAFWTSSTRYYCFARASFMEPKMWKSHGARLGQWGGRLYSYHRNVSRSSFIQRFLKIYTPVSYTHLDVYKRQS